jgi:hypothetical protein
VATVRAYVTRESVCAVDDLDPPHLRRFYLPDDWTWESLVHHVWQESELPRIAGGQATWALSSNIPLAVAAQQWQKPSILFRLGSDRDRLDISDNEIRLHWSYFAQLDPSIVLRVLRELRLRAVAA